jgi:hypothetical protein
MKAKMMKCGHVATVTRCVNGICDEVCGYFGCGEDGLIEDTNFDESVLEGRQSSCSYCGKLAKSSLNLPFFEYLPERKHDKHYCGCRGWD